VLLTGSLFALLVINVLIHSINFIFNSLPYNPAPLNRGKKNASNGFFGIASQTGFERGFEEAGTRPFFAPVFYENI